MSLFMHFTIAVNKVASGIFTTVLQLRHIHFS